MDSIQRLLCITFMTSQSHLWRYCCIMMSRGPWLLRRSFRRGFHDHRKQPIYECNWIVISIKILLIKTANRMAKIITLSVCKEFQTAIFIQIKSREIKLWRHFPIRSSSWLSNLRHKYGGQKTKPLHCETNSLIHSVSSTLYLQIWIHGVQQHWKMNTYNTDQERHQASWLYFIMMLYRGGTSQKHFHLFIAGVVETTPWVPHC